MDHLVTCCKLVYTFIQTPGLNCYKKIIDDLPVVSNNDKLLAEFHSGILTIIETMRLMSLF